MKIKIPCDKIILSHKMEGRTDMYHVGDQVVYGMHGVCVIADTETKVVDGKSVIYLVLEPLGQEGARFLVPSHNPAAMGKVHAVLSREELDVLLSSDILREPSWISEEGRRKQVYRELIASGDRIRLIQMVCALYRHRSQLSASGKKLHLCDDNFLRDAEKLLASEVAVIMGISINEAKQYLRTKLKEDA